MFLPRALSAITDAKNAVARLQEVFSAETMGDSPIKIDPEQESALRVVNASFEWEISAQSRDKVKNKGKDGKASGKDSGKSDDEKGEAIDEVVDAQDSDATLPESAAKRRPFRMANISLEVPRGSLVAVVGPVGSGKVRHPLPVSPCKRI